MPLKEIIGILYQLSITLKITLKIVLKIKSLKQQSFIVLTRSQISWVLLLIGGGLAVLS